MKTALERCRELAGIVESRPAYNIALDEERELREAIEAHVGKLTESEIYAEIQSVIEERERLAVQLEARGLLEAEKHSLRLNYEPGQGHKTHADMAALASRAAKGSVLVGKLSALRNQKRPDTGWMEKHSGLPGRDDSPTTDKSSLEARAERSRRLHAAAAFHHFHAAQDHKKLGNKRQEMQHRLAAEAHHARARSREDSEGGSYMIHPKTGKHVDWTPSYDKGYVKAEKNKISRKAKTAAEKERKVWKTGGAETPVA